MQEISMHILDLVQNCLEAGANRVGIEVWEDREADKLVVKVGDNGCGMAPEVVQKAADPFYTTRSTRRIGLGLALLKLEAGQCGGGLRLDSCPGEGTSVTATFQYSHWHRAPIGDMASTLMVILAGNPELNLTYRHTVDQARFDFSSKDIRQGLGGVPLDHPLVLDWLKGYLHQSIDQLGGGDHVG